MDKITHTPDALPADLPSLTDVAAWSHGQATEAHARQAAAAMLAGIGAAAAVKDAGEDGRDYIANLCRLITLRGYTPAELLFAAREVPFDQQINRDWHFAQQRGARVPCLTAADVDRIIGDVRDLVGKLRLQLTAADKHRLLTKYSHHLRDADFHVCGYMQGEDYCDVPIYRYVPRPRRIYDPADYGARPALSRGASAAVARQ